MIAEYRTDRPVNQKYGPAMLRELMENCWLHTGLSNYPNVSSLKYEDPFFINTLQVPPSSLLRVNGSCRELQDILL